MLGWILTSEFIFCNQFLGRKFSFSILCRKIFRALRFETVAVTYATLCACRRLQLNKMPGTTFCVARRGAAGKVNSKLQVSFFYPFVPNFCLVPSREGKIRNILGKKIGTEPGKNSVAGAEPLGRSWLERAGPRWRTGQGWGQGPGRAGGGGGGTCVFLHKYYG